MDIRLLLSGVVLLVMSLSAVASTYVGERNSFGRFHGQGTYTSSNGTSYVGQWRNGERSGKGTQIWPNGDKYTGEWLGDLPNGKGVMSYANGERYVGDFVGGKMSGKGTFSYLDNSKYVGDWLDDLPHGQGVKSYANGDEYIGVFAKGIRSGKGVLTTAEGDKYDGNWAADQKQGKGIQVYANGNIFEGDWLNGMRHGQGILRYATRSVYKGEWVKDRQHGEGSLEYYNGDIYRGSWERGYKMGKGTMIYAAGGRYVGEWSRGVPHGSGVLTSSSGEIFAGEFELGKRHGMGQCTINGKTTQCEYDAGKLLAVEKDSAQSSETQVAIASMEQATATIDNAEQDNTTIQKAAAVAPIKVRPRVQSTNEVERAAREYITGKLALVSLSDASFPERLPEEEIKKLPFYFEHDFASDGVYKQPMASWWQKNNSLLVNQLEIETSDGEYAISILIRNYKGPGKYRLGEDAAVAEIIGYRKYKSDRKDPGYVEVVEDEKGVISGRFSFTAYRNGEVKNPDYYSMTNGFFKVSEKQ